MKLKNVCVAVVALALAVGMTACGGSASSTRLLLLRPLLLRLLPAKLLLLLPHNSGSTLSSRNDQTGHGTFSVPGFFCSKNAPERFLGDLPAHFSEATIRSRIPLRQRAMLILIFPRTGSPVLQRAGSSQWAMVLCPFSGGKGHAAPTAAGTPQWNGDPVQCLPCPLQTRPA